MDVKRTGIVLRPDPSRILLRLFNFSNEERITKIIARIMFLSEAEVEQQIEQVLAEFGGRHQKLERIFLKRFEEVRPFTITDQPLSHAHQLLIGAYFTHEYS